MAETTCNMPYVKNRKWTREAISFYLKSTIYYNLVVRLSVYEYACCFHLIVRWFRTCACGLGMELGSWPVAEHICVRCWVNWLRCNQNYCGLLYLRGVGLYHIYMSCLFGPVLWLFAFNLWYKTAIIASIAEEITASFVTVQGSVSINLERLSNCFASKKVYPETF